MFKKVNNVIFILLFLSVFFIPLLFAKWESGGVSEEENRNLAKFPSITIEGKFNTSFTKEFETWFMDHMGFRQDLITANKTLQKNIFDRALTTSDYKTGKTGDSIYATNAMIQDFAHVNLRSEEDVAEIGQSYQIVSDWLAERDIPFYYVQCVDKHTIYPERFVKGVKQIGTVSKTDQVLSYLDTNTSVNAIYFKEVLKENSLQYDVFSHWGDPTHWTPRGAYISYRYMMECINKNMDQPLHILDESEYKITKTVQTGGNNQKEEIEEFTINQPNAGKVDAVVMEQWAEDQRHSAWKNPEADNEMRLLIMGDSYFNSYLIDDIAESFSEVWLVWGDYTSDLAEIVDLYDPDIVIYECAERVDRSGSIVLLAEKLIDKK